MSNSSLVCYANISPNKTKRNNKIDTITIHCMAGNLTIEKCGDIFANVNRKASSNYGIGSDGRIGLYCPEDYRSWCTSSSSNDNRAITIEVANDGGEPDWHVSDAALDSLIKLCADICKRNNIKKLLWKADKSLIGQTEKQNMTVHRWFANKACPGNYLYNKHGYIADEVNKILNGGECEMTVEEVNALIEKNLDIRKDIKDCPVEFQSVLYDLKNKGILKGDGKYELNMPFQCIRTLILTARQIESK